MVSFTPNSEARSTATSILPAMLLLSLPVKPDLPLPACSQPSQSHPYQQCQIHCDQPVPCEATLFEKWEWACQSSETKHVTALQGSKQSQIHHYQRASGESRSTATSLLQAKPVLPQPVKPDALLPVYSQCARLSQRWEWACLSGKTTHFRTWKVSMSELWEWACQSCRRKLVGVMRVRV